jgi:hypothetical protein
VSAQIGGDLDCTGAGFGGGLNAARATIGGTLFWKGIIDPNHAGLNLENASANTFEDDDGMPTVANLNLDGFAYKRISGRSGGVKNRMRWLALLQSFAPQPYRQLAKVLREEGDDAGARLVLSTMEQLRRKHENAAREPFARFWASTWSQILKATVGYGFHPARSLLWLLRLVILGAGVFSLGYAAGSIAPTNKAAYASFKGTGQLPPNYNRFNPLMFSLENSFPLIKLGQADSWQADPNAHWESHPKEWVPRFLLWTLSPWSLRWIRWMQICLGWFFATMGLAAVSGLVRKD